MVLGWEEDGHICDSGRSPSGARALIAGAGGAGRYPLPSSGAIAASSPRCWLCPLSPCRICPGIWSCVPLGYPPLSSPRSLSPLLPGPVVAPPTPYECVGVCSLVSVCLCGRGPDPIFSGGILAWAALRVSWGLWRNRAVMVAEGDSLRRSGHPAGAAPLRYAKESIFVPPNTVHCDGELPVVA